MPKDFSNQDLRGKSFKGQDLTGANFSHADIRGSDFKGAILKGAKFINAKGGVTKKSFTVYLLMILILSVLTGFSMASCIFLAAEVVKSILTAFKSNTDTNVIIYTLLFFIVYVPVLAVPIRKGKYSLWKISIITAAAGVAAVTEILPAIGVTVAVTGASAIAISGAGAVFAAIAVTGAGAIAVTGALSIAVAITGFAAGSVKGFIAGAVVGATIIQLILSFYIAYRTHKEDEKFEPYRKFGISLSSMFGTNFDGANLTDANFSRANLKSCRFSKETVIMRTCFKNAGNLKFARLTGTILENKAIRELLVSGYGKNQSYAGMNLNGAYLVNADLTEADLSGATLEKANLKDANLSRTQALGVEFRGADFTGACLESWNIDSTTRLDGANADYVYLLGNQQECRPPSGSFGQGEFAKLFSEAIDTVDFIFRNGIDWQVFMISFDKLREKIRAESEDAEISIQSIANKGDGVFVIKVNVPPLTDKPEFHREFNRDYDNQLKLLEEKYKAQLEAKEDVITVYREQNINLLDIIKYQAQRPVAVRNIKTEIHGNINNSSVIAGDENDVRG